MSKRRFVSESSAFAGAFAGIVMLLRAGPMADGARAGLSLCSGLVVPTLFPFMALSIFLCESPASETLGRMMSPLTRLLRLPKSCGSILLAAAIGGYPSAAKCVSAAVKNGRLDRDTAGRMLTFCVNAGPPFLVSAVGTGIFGSTATGLVLLASQIASALVIGIAGALFAKGRHTGEAPCPAYPSLSACAVHSVSSAAGAAFNMCAFIVIFSALAGLAEPLTSLLLGGGGIPAALTAGFFEVTAGCAACGGLRGYAGPVAAAAIASFSGISVMFQTAGATEGSGVSLRGFLISRPLHAALTALICRALLGLFPETVESLSRFESGVPYALSVSAPAFVSLLCMLSLFLLSLVPQNSKYSIEKDCVI